VESDMYSTYNEKRVTCIVNKMRGECHVAEESGMVYIMRGE